MLNYTEVVLKGKFKTPHPNTRKEYRQISKLKSRFGTDLKPLTLDILPNNKESKMKTLAYILILITLFICFHRRLKPAPPPEAFNKPESTLKGV